MWPSKSHTTRSDRARFKIRHTGIRVHAFDHFTTFSLKYDLDIVNAVCFFLTRRKNRNNFTLSTVKCPSGCSIDICELNATGNTIFRIMYFIYSISFNPNTLGNPCHDSSHSGSPCSGDPEYVESAIEQNILEENLLQFLPFQKKKN